MLITVEQFRRLFPRSTEPEAWAAALNGILPRYAIYNNPLRLAMFLAQTGHESDGFTDLTENLNYSAEGLARTWPTRYAVDPKAATKVPNDLARRLHRQPEAIANNCYANRMGNGPESSGDGWRFRGYGLIQLTGRANREAFAKAIGQPLDAAEAYLLTYEGAIESACWYWSTRNINPLADAGNVLAVTKSINAGVNGLADRQARYAEALKILAV
ncbi:glycoside hydrolase family 19 protein [Geobacter sp. SVR]|uniref:glycoside hydrolase family 19 protein n=1 Tax=Geobacter sp. SVR TaxID=2495594 RepID=UPI00143EFDE5|nr:glycoside hydrolase family 19 protein [Geobacter sp. SVR]BCS55178.1 hypothetical protein GSVR_34860 [Geobacter sp. SVR]GCF85359.1 hypothetical protein GSbR_19590 [Geobacter sp. SVR]